MPVADRYELSEFRDFKQEFIPSTNASQSKLSNLIKLSEFSSNDRPLATRMRSVAVPFLVNIANSTATAVGRVLLDVDLELRRSSALQLRNTTSPTRDPQLVDLISMKGDDDLQIELAISGELHHALTSRPIDFLITLDWIWDYRYARSRVRSPLITHDPRQRWAGIMSSALACTDMVRSVYTTMTVGQDGSTTFAFRSAGTTS